MHALCVCAVYRFTPTYIVPFCYSFMENFHAIANLCFEARKHDLRRTATATECEALLEESPKTLALHLASCIVFSIQERRISSRVIARLVRVLADVRNSLAQHDFSAFDAKLRTILVEIVINLGDQTQVETTLCMQFALSLIHAVWTEVFANVGSAADAGIDLLAKTHISFQNTGNRRLGKAAKSREFKLGHLLREIIQCHFLDLDCLRSAFIESPGLHNLFALIFKQMSPMSIPRYEILASFLGLEHAPAELAEAGVKDSDTGGNVEALLEQILRDIQHEVTSKDISASTPPATKRRASSYVELEDDDVFGDFTLDDFNLVNDNVLATNDGFKVPLPRPIKRRRTIQEAARELFDNNPAPIPPPRMTLPNHFAAVKQREPQQPKQTKANLKTPSQPRMQELDLACYETLPPHLVW